jgi:hypothetical protein
VNGGAVKYHHLGIPTSTPREGEEYLADFGMFVSGFETSEFGVEWIRFEPTSPLPELVRTVPHVAFEVTDLEAALEGREVLIEPNSPSPGVRVAFVVENGAPIEFLEIEDSEAAASGARLRRGFTAAELRNPPPELAPYDDES